MLDFINVRIAANQPRREKINSLQGTAPPPDVRRGLCPAGSCRSVSELCPWSGLRPNFIGHFRFGFAAGCEAVAMPPPAAGQIIPGLSPLVRA
ncbi:MAG: hypothetical protein ABR568_21635 [Pyrinomonadaceae bacterium]